MGFVILGIFAFCIFVFIVLFKAFGDSKIHNAEKPEKPEKSENSKSRKIITVKDLIPLIRNEAITITFVVLDKYLMKVYEYDTDYTFKINTLTLNYGGIYEDIFSKLEVVDMRITDDGLNLTLWVVDKEFVGPRTGRKTLDAYSEWEKRNKNRWIKYQ